ncbi:phosphoribosylglycinamide formyltransferase [Alphaproteobacteria bacterium]|nr:phosphoribosylglycinamide formyltransferase [Alphaproteobacteria bacterium]
MPSNLRVVKTAIFISGRGSNMKSLIKYSQKKNSKIEIAKVFSNNKTAQGIEIAKKLNVPEVFYYSNKFFEEKIKKNLDDIELICLAGFMKILSPSFVKKWKERLINIHPSYLPNFKGLNAQRKAIETKASFSGCTVHYVNKKIDSGNIIKQKKIKILKKDNTESLTKKILIEEHKLYPKALNVVVNRLLLNEKIN